jgi:hypothetical protein
MDGRHAKKYETLFSYLSPSSSYQRAPPKRISPPSRINLGKRSSPDKLVSEPSTLGPRARTGEARSPSRPTLKKTAVAASFLTPWLTNQDLVPPPDLATPRGTEAMMTPQSSDPLLRWMPSSRPSVHSSGKSATRDLWVDASVTIKQSPRPHQPAHKPDGEHGGADGADADQHRTAVTARRYATT